MRKGFYWILLIGLILVSATIIMDNFQKGNEKFIPQLKVIGDVREVLIIKDPEIIENKQIKYKDEQIRVISLSEIIKLTKPISTAYDLVFRARDGLRTRINGQNLANSYIHYSSSYGWEVINLNHPPSSNVKLLEEIVVVAGESDQKEMFTIITPEKNLYQQTVGQLLNEPYLTYPVFEGSSQIKKEGSNNQVEVFTEKRVLNPVDLIEQEIGPDALVIGSQGQLMRYQDGYLELGDQQINYLNPAEELRLDDCRGMIIDPPVSRNSDSFYDALYYLEDGQAVLIIILDGFGYHQYQYAVENGFAPFLARQKAQKALIVYQPVTNAGLAAILTGKGPEENGVYSRKQKELLVPDIFAEAGQDRSLYIEGNIKILNTSIEPLLNPDVNGNGSTDDEVYSAALRNIKQDYQLLVVHFHGIDDNGHTYGSKAEETLQAIKQTDDYLQTLLEQWSGKVIITADHGMHDQVQGGDHGAILTEDMFVPYMIIDGGR